MDGKSAKKGTKTGKNRAKNAKKPLKKSKFALAHLTKGTPSAEKNPGASAKAGGFPKNRPKIPRQTGSKKLSTIAAARKLNLGGWARDRDLPVAARTAAGAQGGALGSRLNGGGGLLGGCGAKRELAQRAGDDPALAVHDHLGQGAVVVAREPLGEDNLGAALVVPFAAS